jgi:hypothetical protein
MAGAIRNLLLRDARLETAILGELRELPVAKNLNPFGFVGIYYLRRLSDSFVAQHKVVAVAEYQVDTNAECRQGGFRGGENPVSVAGIFLS